VNCREKPDINSSVVRKLSVDGEVVEFISTTSVNYYVWNQYRDLSEREFWVRNDVHNYALMNTYKKLDVDYVSQKDEESNISNNDCGAASLLILMKYYKKEINLTVNDLTLQMQIGNNFASFTNLINISKKKDFNPKFYRPYTISNIIDKLNENHPVLVLVNYNQLYPGNNYGHFFVVVGYDYNGFFVHDPYKERDMYFNYSKFSLAYSQKNTGANLPYQAMYLDNIRVDTSSIITIVNEIERLLQILKKEVNL